MNKNKIHQFLKALFVFIFINPVWANITPHDSKINTLISHDPTLSTLKKLQDALYDKLIAQNNPTLISSQQHWLANREATCNIDSTNATGLTPDNQLCLSNLYKGRNDELVKLIQQSIKNIPVAIFVKENNIPRDKFPFPYGKISYTELTKLFDLPVQDISDHPQREDFTTKTFHYIAANIRTCNDYWKNGIDYDGGSGTGGLIIYFETMCTPLRYASYSLLANKTFIANDKILSIVSACPPRALPTFTMDEYNLVEQLSSKQTIGDLIKKRSFKILSTTEQQVHAEFDHNHFYFRKIAQLDLFHDGVDGVLLQTTMYSAEGGTVHVGGYIYLNKLTQNSPMVIYTEQELYKLFK